MIPALIASAHVPLAAQEATTRSGVGREAADGAVVTVRDSRESAFDLGVVYTGDLFGNVSGGVATGVDYLGDLSAVLRLDLESLLGWNGGSFFLYSLLNHGADPTDRVGDLQGVSNIEAPDTWKIYEAWFEQILLQRRLSVLVGLYDLNSEFDVIESAGLFLNSSFGIGADYSQSGRNGPSVFPTTSLGARVAGRPIPALTLRAAVLDGVPGDPDDPHGTQIILRERDGALIAWEADLLLAFQDPRRPSTRRIGRGHQYLPYRAKLAIGGWHYTADLPDLLAAGSPARPTRRHPSRGFYILGEYVLSRRTGSSERALTIFGRVGWADPSVNPLVAYTGAGAVWQGPLPGRAGDRLGLGVAAAFNGERFESAQAAAGRPVESAEVTVELTYRAELASWLAVQPDIQYVINPGTESENPNAWVLAVRTELSIE